MVAHYSKPKFCQSASYAVQDTPHLTRKLYTLERNISLHVLSFLKLCSSLSHTISFFSSCWWSSVPLGISSPQSSFLLSCCLVSSSWFFFFFLSFQLTTLSEPLMHKILHIPLPLFLHIISVGRSSKWRAAWSLKLCQATEDYLDVLGDLFRCICWRVMETAVLPHYTHSLIKYFCAVYSTKRIIHYIFL